MAVGNLTFFADFKELLAKAQVDLDGDTFKLLLLSSGYTPSSTGQSVLTDITANELSTGTGGYNRATLASVTVTESGGTVTFDAADTTALNSSSITCKYMVIYDDTTTGDTLVGYVDLETGGGVVTSSALSFTWNSAGLFTLSG